MNPTASDLRARYGGEWQAAGPNLSSLWLGVFAVDLVVYNNPMSLYRFGAVIRVERVNLATASGQSWQETLDNLFRMFHLRISILPDGRAQDDA
jgi:hypothetical protein